MQSIFDSCVPRTEVLSGDLTEEIFAARLRDVIEGSADSVYQDPRTFFDNTYPTEGLRLLLIEALGRLSGQAPGNNAIIRLETAFGGGKTHNLIALFHAARGFLPNEAAFVAPEFIPEPGAIRICGVVGTDLEPTVGIHHDGATTYTLWGEIAYQLGGADAFSAIAQSEASLSAPGTEFLEQIIGDAPTLIMIDEIARHLRTAKAVTTPNGRSDLAEQTSAFLMSLFEFAASKRQVVVVFTLAEATDAFGKENEELKQQLEQVLTEIKRVAARQERVITPAVETEIAAIVNHRLFRSVDTQAGEEVANAYVTYYQRELERNADIPQRSVRAEYMQELLANYPFHPELLLTLNRKVSTIPNFQRTRGALRLLAMVIRDLWQKSPENTFLIHPHHVNLGIEGIANDLTSRLERPRFKQVIEADICSPDGATKAHAQELDALPGSKPFTQYAATTVFLNSIVQGAASGIEAADLALAVMAPGDDPALIVKAIDKLVDRGWFIEYDGRRYRFKTEASINKIITEEMSMVGQVPSKNALDDRIRQIWKKGYFQPAYFPSEPGAVDDSADLPRLVLVHYDAARTTATDGAPPEFVARLFEHSGTQQGFRLNKNNVVFLVADRDQVDTMIAVVQRYLAIQRIISDPQRMGELFEEQRRKLQEFSKSAELEVRVAITKAYRWLFYPSEEAPQEHAKLAREQLRPEDQGEVSEDQSRVVLRTLKQLEKVLVEDTPMLAAQFVRSKAWNLGQTDISTDELRKVFARKLGLRMLLDINQLKSTIRNGIQQGVWVYYDAREQQGYNAQSPMPVIQISEDTFLYTPEAYKSRGWPIKGVMATPAAAQDGDSEAEAIILKPFGGMWSAGAAQAGPAKPPTVLRGEGAPAQAMQGILDTCADAKVKRIAGLKITIDGEGKQGAIEVRSLGVAIPQLGRADFHIEQDVVAEMGDDSIHVEFNGGWDRYKRFKAVTDTLSGEAQLRLTASTTLTITFPGGLDVSGNQFSTMTDVFSSLSFGHMRVEAQPLAEDKA